MLSESSADPFAVWVQQHRPGILFGGDLFVDPVEPQNLTEAICDSKTSNCLREPARPGCCESRRPASPHVAKGTEGIGVKGRLSLRGTRFEAAAIR